MLRMYPLGGYKVKPRLVSLKLAIFLIALEIIVGTLTYYYLEGFRFLDALYMTVITISTVGFSEVQTLSDAGHVFTICLILVNVGVIAYGLYVATYYIFEGELFKNMHEKFITKKIEELNDHVILCGYGRYGQETTEIFRNHNVPFIVIDRSEDVIHDIQNSDMEVLYLAGDSTEDEVLVHAGIKRARSFISALPDDADNVFTVLTARQLNPKLDIISRAHNKKSANKLKLAGANHVIMPEQIGGFYMATIVYNPNAIEFFNFLTSEREEEMGISEIQIKSAPKHWHNKTIGQLQIPENTGANIIGMRDHNGKFIINPKNEMVLTEKCNLIVLGDNKHLSNLAKYVAESQES